MIQTEMTMGLAMNRQPVGATLPRPRGLFRPPGGRAAPAEPRPAPIRSADSASSAARGGKLQRHGRPFHDAEGCIMWMVQTLAAEAEGGPRNCRRHPPATSVCTPAEVTKCLDMLYRRRRIDLHHVRILRLWGQRGRAPNPANPMEKADWHVWREALDRLDWPLRSLGIIS